MAPATPDGPDCSGLLSRLGGCLAFLLFVVAVQAASNTGEARPNVVVIIADDLGYGDLGCYGGTAIPTPNLDRLAAKGVRFTQAYAPASTCTPSRYALLSGEYAWRQPANKTSILPGDAPLAFDLARPTLASFFRSQGYATGLVGKWHLGLGDGHAPVDFNGMITPGPLEVGFDTAFFIPATVDRVPCVFVHDHRVAALDINDPMAVSYSQRVGSDPVGYEHPELLKYGADRQHSEVIVNGISRIGSMSGGQSARWVDEEIADTLARHSVDFIMKHREHPFFLLLGTHDPHVPRMPHPRFRGRSTAGIRGDAIVQLDWVVGEIMDALERTGVAGKTLVLFTSDNGPVLFDGYYDGSKEANAGHRPAGVLRGWKFLRYEGGTRVPLIASWPGRAPEGTVTDRMFSLHDVFASAAGLLGQPLPAGAGRDGLDLSALWLGGIPGRTRDFIVQQGAGNVLALRKGDWKFVPRNIAPASGIGGADPRDQRFTEVQTPEDQLFDLSVDPAEQHNLAAAQPAKVAEMAALLAALSLASEHEVRSR